MSLSFANFLHTARFRFCTSVLSTCALLFTLAPQADAAVRKNVSEYAGQRCNPPPRGSGVIVGIFQGLGESQFNFSDAPQTISRYRCFSSMDECKGWLYTMQSLYSAGMPRAVECLKR